MSDVAADQTVAPKSAKQLEKEAKKLQKLEKFKQKQESQAVPIAKVATDKEKKEKRKHAKIDVVEYTGDTKPGEKKDVSGPMPQSYSPQFVEAAWYSWWEKQGFFKPEYGRESISAPNEKGKFVMVIPPPNVTGHLHVGHALTNAIEDTITRWNRMRGLTTLWNPGCDHAGIATQVVVEKQLWKENKLRRHDIGREEFVKKVWQWKNEKGDRIYEQLRRLGSSLDWERAAFTMDDKLSRAVTEAFVRLHESGDIYRSNRLVNWSCSLKSAISDIEVDKLEISGKTYLSIPGYEKPVQFGVLVYFSYPVIGMEGREEVVVATTRVETMLGDSAVAVHPEDGRYAHLRGHYVYHPLCDREIPIIFDTFVDREFGTGVVKITPAHDHNDYEIGLKHNLPFRTVIDDEGRICGDCGDFKGLKRFEARVAIIEELKKRGMYRDTKENPMIVPICNRSKDVVEPLLKPQWYVKCDEMAKEAIRVVEKGELKITPEHHKKIWFHWMNNIRDWCISRQLWWGHRIPAYKIVPLPIPTEEEFDYTEQWVSARTKEEAWTKAVKLAGTSKIKIVQDEDVLDTWFSSALFPFSVFGWPEATPDLETFFPGTLLETGHDILFFWVARMVFFSQKLTGQLPFKEVFLHPMVRDAHGRKMSKSLGNVVDPMDVIRGATLEQLHAQLVDSNLDGKEVEKAKAGQRKDYPEGIPECGTDALRIALCSYLTQGRDIHLDVLRIQGYRFFCNKIWNAVKFALLYFPPDFIPTGKLPIKNPLFACDQMIATEAKCCDEFEDANNWMLSRVYNVAQQCQQAFSLYDLSSAATACYNLWLYDLCDFYLESLKPVFAGENAGKISAARETLAYVINASLRLLSPFMPFITEELYQRIPKTESNTWPSICVARYPEPDLLEKDGIFRNPKLEADVDFIQKVIHAIRSAQSDYNVPKATKTEAFAVCTDDSTREVIGRFSTELKALGNCSEITCTQEPHSGCVILTISDKCQIHLALKDLIDVTKELEKLSKRKETLEEKVEKMEKLQSESNYEEKVPLHVRNAQKEKQTQMTGELEHLTRAIQMLENMKI